MSAISQEETFEAIDFDFDRGVRGHANHQYLAVRPLQREKSSIDVGVWLALELSAKVEVADIPRSWFQI